MSDSMLIALAEGLVLTAGVYALLGLLVSVAIQVRGLAVIDPATAGAGWGFRLLITPGLIALWPLMARRWMRAAKLPPGSDPLPAERNAHRDAARDPAGEAP